MMHRANVQLENYHNVVREVERRMKQKREASKAPVDQAADLSKVKPNSVRHKPYSNM